jgi:hypothetical protein
MPSHLIHLLLFLPFQRMLVDFPRLFVPGPVPLLHPILLQVG